MPGCCAFGCSNRDSKGFLMKRFPSDPERRKLWEAKVKRDNWKPTNSSYLCEVHFTPDCFEQNRADGKRRLKPNAIPTIFSFLFTPEKHRKPPTLKRSPREKKELVPNVQEPSTSQATEAQESNHLIPTSSSSCAPSPYTLLRMRRKELKMGGQIVQYVLVRSDLLKTLKWPVGAVIAQACHACTAAIHLFYEDISTQTYLKDLDNMHKIVLEVPDESGLIALADVLKEGNIKHKLWIEQPENYPTCLVLKPYPKEEVQKYFTKYKLMKG